MFPSSIKIENKIYKPIDASPVGRFARILTDYERTSDHRPRTHGAYNTIPSIDYRYMKCYESNVGVPDVINLFDDTWFKLDSKKQWFWMDLNCFSQYGKIYSDLSPSEKREAMASYKNLTHGGRAFTNGCGWNDGRRDYVIPANISSKSVVEQEQVTCSLNRVKIIGDVQYFYSNYLGLGSKKYAHYKIECLNPNIVIPDRINNKSEYILFIKNMISKDWICHNPSTSSGMYLGNGIYEINKFPQFGEKSKFILWGINGYGWVRADWVELL